MDQSVITEHDCNVLGGLFQIIISDLKVNDHSINSIFGCISKVADMATTTRGGTKEIGTALTRLCLRHRSVEAKLKSFSSAILDCLITPLQDRIEEWKKTTLQLDKEHNKELKRLRQEFKKRQMCDSMMSNSGQGHYRSKKHSNRMSKGSKYDFFDSISSKGIYGTIGSLHKSNSSNLSRSLDSEMECNERLIMFEDLEKKAVRRALIEERSHFCLFVKFLRPVVEEEIAMIQEITHIQEIIDSLSKQTDDPFDLPPSSEIVISSLKLSKPGGNVGWNFHHQTPPSSPSSLGSRKSSMCSISSYNSSSSGSNYGQTGPNKYLSLTHIPTGNYGSNSIYSTNESIYMKKSEYSTTYDAGHCSPKTNETNELQFHLETDQNNKSEYQQHDNQSNTTAQSHRQHEQQQQQQQQQRPFIMKSTNPFLDMFSPDQIQSSNDHIQNNDGNGIYSEGSITPTNSDVKTNELFGDQNNGAITPSGSRNGKPPPAPPVRRTSSISNPNAITLGTLRNAAINTNYDQMGNNTSVYDEINVLTKSMNDINYSLKYTDFGNTQIGTNSTDSPTTTTNAGRRPSNESIGGSGTPKLIDHSNEKSEYQSVKSIFEGYSSSSSGIGDSHHQHSLHHHHQLSKEESIDSQPKLSQSPLVHQNNSTRISKRRSSSQSANPEECDQTYSKSRSSIRSSSTTRAGNNSCSTSRKNSFEKSTLIGNFRENFIDKLSQSLMQKQQLQQQQNPEQQMAKVAQTNILQRKQSVPDLNELNTNYHKNQNRVTFSSTLNLHSPTQQQSSSSFQVVQIQTNSTQQPIYASRNQLRREIQELYGTIGQQLPPQQSLYGDSNYQNGFFNKL
ncbi:MTSS1-like protein [Blomia tropicalis]|nr:MTSS1-like protein [Blomia tropicalis]